MSKNAAQISQYNNCLNSINLKSINATHVKMMNSVRQCYHYAAFISLHKSASGLKPFPSD